MDRHALGPHVALPPLAQHLERHAGPSLLFHEVEEPQCALLQDRPGPETERTRVGRLYLRPTIGGAGTSGLLCCRTTALEHPYLVRPRLQLELPPLREGGAVPHRPVIRCLLDGEAYGGPTNALWTRAVGVALGNGGGRRLRVQWSGAGDGIAGTCLREESPDAPRDRVHPGARTGRGTSRRVGDCSPLRFRLVLSSLWQQARFRGRAVLGRCGTAADDSDRSWVHQPRRELGAFSRTNVRWRTATGSLSTMLRRDVQLQSISARNVLASRWCVPVAKVTRSDKQRKGTKPQREARTAVIDFIEGCYNTHRRHSALDYESPVSHESRQTAAI